MSRKEIQPMPSLLPINNNNKMILMKCLHSFTFFQPDFHMKIVKSFNFFLVPNNISSHVKGEFLKNEKKVWNDVDKYTVNDGRQKCPSKETRYQVFGLPFHYKSFVCKTPVYSTLSKSTKSSKGQ